MFGARYLLTQTAPLGEIDQEMRRLLGVIEQRAAVADHQRIWASHQTISDPEHVQAAKRLRLQRIGVVRPAPEPDVQIRCLADYDDALGVGDLEGGVA